MFKKNGFGFFNLMIILGIIALLTLYGRSFADPYLVQNKLKKEIKLFIETKNKEKNLLEQNMRKDVLDRLRNTGLTVEEDELVIDNHDDIIKIKIVRDEVVRISDKIKVIIDIGFEEELKIVN